MADIRFRFRWCDGLIPQNYLLDVAAPRIEGSAWMCDGPEQELWEFALFLDGPVDSPFSINWESLLPPANVTRWIAVDPPNKRIQFEPSAAVPDSAAS
ncbi:MAG TPA: hypothetical protein VKS79_17840 [Gemmataceae bacterium]|nr:hypothetical protein [Gemmataceae bacterium]